MSSLQRDGKNLTLVPVVVNYDRLFEMRNLATEIVSGDTGQISAMTIGRMIRQQSKQTVGKVYVTFGEAIELKKYLIKHKMSPLN